MDSNSFFCCSFLLFLDSRWKLDISKRHHFYKPQFKAGISIPDLLQFYPEDILGPLENNIIVCHFWAAWNGGVLTGHIVSWLKIWPKLCMNFSKKKEFESIWLHYLYFCCSFLLFLDSRWKLDISKRHHFYKPQFKAGISIPDLLQFYPEDILGPLENNIIVCPVQPI